MQKAGYIALIIYILASSTGVLTIKSFFNQTTYQDLSEFAHLLVDMRLIGGVVLYIIGFLAWLYVLSKMNLNTAYPVAVTLSFITILILSILVLKEKFTANILIGTVLCIVGISVILR
jgi:small multidrug resistance pump